MKNEIIMQKYITPHPGRTPEPQPQANVIDLEHYKVDVKLTELRNENWQLEISTWIPEHGWMRKEWFFTMEELRRLQKSLSI